MKISIFKSLKRGLKEAIAWTQGKKTGARVRIYCYEDIEKIRNKKI